MMTDNSKQKQKVSDEETDFHINSGEPLRLITLFGGYRHKQLEGRNYMLELGNPAIVLLLAYLLTLPGIILVFFLYKSLWYFGFDLYSLYVFILSTGCVGTGVFLLYNRYEQKKSGLKVRNVPIAIGATVLAIISLLLVIIFGRESFPLAILFSIFFVIALMMGVLVAPKISRHDIAPFSLYGIGAVMVAFVPVHQAFGMWAPGGGVFIFTLLDGALVVIGVTLALLGLNSIRNRAGLFSCWLIGAAIIALISFHEIVSISASGSFEIYDQILALEGSIFSIVPLFLYMLNEFRSAKLWNCLLGAIRALEVKDYERALREGEKAMELLSDSGFSNKVSLPWSVYGDIFYRMGKLNRAKTCYDLALQIDPRDAETWSNLGNMLAVRGYGEQALVTFQKAVAANPEDPRIWNNLGVVLLSLKKYDEAMSSFRMAVEKDPDFTTAYYNAGIIQLRLGRPASAMRYFEKLISLVPEDQSARQAYERTEMILDYFQQAAGWKMLGLDISNLVRTVIDSPKKFDAEYQRYVGGIVDDLSDMTFGGDKDKAEIAVHGLLRLLGQSGIDIPGLKSSSGLDINQLRFAVAVLALANIARFRSIGNELRLMPVRETMKAGKERSAVLGSREEKQAIGKPSIT